MSDHVSRYHVVSTAYTASTTTLLVRLASGIYRYDLVPHDLAMRFAAAGDQDAFFLRHINEKFPTTYLPSSDPGYQAADSALSAESSSPTRVAAVGTATMLADGTLHLRLRSETPQGIAESLLVIAPTDPRYSGMVTHLGGLKPGGSCAIPPFPESEADPNEVK